jgi:hypothetical protein
MSMYVPALAMARYSPSWEKLRAFIAFLENRDEEYPNLCCSVRNLLARCDCTSAYPFGQVKHIDNGVVSPGCEISIMFTA